MVSGNSDGAVTGAKTTKNAVENNVLGVLGATEAAENTAVKVQWTIIMTGIPVAVVKVRASSLQYAIRAVTEPVGRVMY
nr:VENN motif pre-toxin domain-containing protein [Morganella morganii]